MKIMVYGVHQPELEALKDFEKNNDVSLTLSEKIFDIDSVELVKGHDGVCIQQSEVVDDEKVFQILKENNIKQIALRTAGFDMVDLKLAKKYDIKVTYVPAYSPNAIAEMALFHIMYLTRRMYVTFDKMNKNNFLWAGSLADEVRSLTVGIVGVGRIGGVLAKLLHGIGAKVIGYDIKVNQEANPNVEFQASLEDLLKKADVVSLHTPIDETTKDMINSKTLSLMKETAYLVNTARGGIVDTNALIDALKNNKIAGAGLDTLDCEIGYFDRDFTNKEIKNDNLRTLINMTNVLITPHIAFYSKTAIKNMVDIGLDSTLDILKTGTSINLVKEVK